VENSVVFCGKPCGKFGENFSKSMENFRHFAEKQRFSTGFPQGENY
jgi:hypothetical protein